MPGGDGGSPDSTRRSCTRRSALPSGQRRNGPPGAYARSWRPAASQLNPGAVETNIAAESHACGSQTGETSPLSSLPRGSGTPTMDTVRGVDGVQEGREMSTAGAHGGEPPGPSVQLTDVWRAAAAAYRRSRGAGATDRGAHAAASEAALAVDPGLGLDGAMREASAAIAYAAALYPEWMWAGVRR